MKLTRAFIISSFYTMMASAGLWIDEDRSSKAALLNGEKQPTGFEKLHQVRWAWRKTNIVSKSSKQMHTFFLPLLPFLPLIPASVVSFLIAFFSPPISSLCPSLSLLPCCTQLFLCSFLSTSLPFYGLLSSTSNVKWQTISSQWAASILPWQSWKF